jgi:hypothetical protein
MPAVEQWSDVDVDDVAVLQLLVAGNSVADHVVDRNAARMGVAAVAEGGRHGAPVERHLPHHVVEFAGGHARLHQRRKCIEDLGGKAACLAHALEAFRPVQLDRAVADDGLVAGNGLVLGHARRCRR